MVLEKIYRPQRSQVSVGMLLLYGRSVSSWSNKKQRTLSGSTDNAKRMALGLVLRAGIWMRRFLNGMGLGEAGDITLNGDRVTMSRAYCREDQTKHPVVQQITCARHSMERNCMLPG